MTTFEYGAVSSKYSLKAENKLTAYATMVLHFQSSANLIAIYSPESCKEDMWLSFTGKISERLDEIFGGEGSFEKYIQENMEAIKACYKTVKQLV